MQRHVSILRRKPRTRRERLLVRFHAARAGVDRRWARLRRTRRTRAARRRAQELFLHLGQGAHLQPAEPLGHARRGRPHVPHIRHR